MALSHMFFSVFCWSLFDASRKFLSTHFSPLFLSVALTLSQAPFFLVWALLDSGDWPAAPYALSGSLGILFNSLASLLFLQALAIAPLSKTIPMLSFAPLLASAFSFLSLSEVPTILALVGMLLIVAGAFLLNATRDDLKHPRLLLQAAMREKGCLLMLVVAGLWGCSSLTDKISLGYTSVPKHALIQVCGVVLFLGSALIFVHSRKGNILQSLAVVSKRPAFWLSMVFATSALAFQLTSIQVIQVGVFEAIKRSTGVLLSALIGAVLFHEKISKVHILGLIVMALGSALAFL